MNDIPNLPAGEFGEYGYLEAQLRGQLYGNGPKMVRSRISRGVIPFGRAVFAELGNVNECFLPVADTNTLTLSTDLIVDNVLTITVNGVAVVQPWVTDNDTTLDLMLIQLNSLADNVRASRVGLIFTIRTPGTPIVITGAVTGGVTQAIVTIGTPVVPANLVFVGVAVRIQKVIPRGTTDGDVYVDSDMVSVLDMGDIVVEIDGTAVVAISEPAQVLSGAAEGGLFSAAGGANQKINGIFISPVPGKSTLYVVHIDKAGNVA